MSRFSSFSGAIKVECGSQFSVALTRSGAVFTWGKGDYHRLGHGNDDHVRRPKKVAALQVTNKGTNFYLSDLFDPLD